ncbi:nitroreductase family protein [Pasteurella atlantica]|uniref:nitroreductase family protein n=1 Tax=Pasteurellaceae TaxID=712 RepID=UPI00274A437C|nr:nitroreductase family protein [Pasteurella atlantica]MDP8033606.1 nitroreductase family protein [Pasteurella atlantica]MDP8035614.1 nitroreductase family protein [Pasteurella atlantica]MDP8037565.1 nitroreductase family protein [Pasteurella atlantica]MDP8047914.1 nitroreductase family protein [Pasteurella atlantica]MDP8049869.1 nitroreductase family protein [Pasteurella atlantica]
MNSTLHLLQHRRSSRKFNDVAPNQAELDHILKAALRAPDHGLLKPYHFVVIDKSGMPQLKQHLIATVNEFDMGSSCLDTAESITSTTPMIIGVVCKYSDKKPIPEWEQMLTAGCATYAMQLAANAQGFETCWITNKWVEGSALRHAFGCTEKDKIIALVRIGKPAEQEQISTTSQSEAIESFVSYIK